MKRVIYTRPDGGVSIMTPTAEFRAKFKTEDEAIAPASARSVPSDASDIQVQDNPVLPGREFRDAWRQAAGVVSIDMTAAREIHTGRIDAAKRVAARDLIERETLGENVTAEKALLAAMDKRPDIATAQTPFALSAVWPPGLNRP